VNAGVVTLKQSIGVIMGANIGTTMTAWIVSLVGFKFSITDVALPAIAIAIPLYFSSRPNRRESADILIGFGLLFLGLSFMKDSVPDIKNNPEVLAFLSDWSHFGFASTLLFVLIGTLLTIIVQSSSAAMTITLTMAFKGWIDFPMSAAIILGENIGTTITAFLASLPMNASAKRAARAHMMFNIIGVLWMLTVFDPFTRLVDFLVPGNTTDPESIPFHLSMFHTMFNVVNTALLVGLVTPLSRLVEWMVKDDKMRPDTGPYKLNIVPDNIPEALDSNLITVRQELVKMADAASDMLQLIKVGVKHPDKITRELEVLQAREQRADDMQEQLTDFLTGCTRQDLGVDQANTVSAQRRIAHELENITDSAYGIGLLLERVSKKEAHFHSKGKEELADYTGLVMDFLKYNQDFLARRIVSYNLKTALDMEEEIDRMRDKLRRRSRRVIEKDEDVDVKGELFYMDIVRHLEHIGDSSLNVSQAIIEMI
jgi:phosphate:Na+ symporter